MLPKTFSQKGQALILIVAAIIGLVAITALAIDAGNVFSDRRHAQNAADTAALAAALAKVNSENITTAAQNRATSNGYNNDGVDSTVTVNNPPVAGCNGTNGPYAGNDEYIQVIIRSTVDTFFAPIVGIDQLHNCVEAIARAKPGESPGLGSAILSLACDGKWAIQAGGITEIVVHGGGLYSNSNDAEAIYVQKLTNLQLDPGYKAVAVGCVNVPLGYPYECHVLPPLFPCPLPADDPLLLQPPYPCDFNIGDFNPPNGTVLTPGVYCISGFFNEADITGTGVTFIMLNKGISWQGNSQMELSAPTGDNDLTKGLLIYLPPSNNNAVTINGTANTNFTGTFLAPSSQVTVSGNLEGVGEIKSTFIGLTIKLTGKGEFTVFYSPGDNWKYKPAIELSK
jgi:hypothetical protein